MTIPSTEAFRDDDGKVISEIELPVAGSVLIKQGEPLLCVAGLVKPMDGTAATGGIFGFSRELVDNSAGGAGDKTCVVDLVQPYSIRLLKLASASPPAAANIGGLVYFDATSNITTSSAGNLAGTFFGLSKADGRAMVALKKVGY